MQSVPFHIAYLLTQCESVIVPGLGAFIVSLSDKEKTSRWGILSPPVYSLEFDPEINHNDGLLANSIEEERMCSHNEACIFIDKYVTQVLNSFDRGKSVHIPWVGVLYRQNNKILFQPDKTLSCNSINYGLTGFSLPHIEELKRETATIPKQNKTTNYLKQSSVVPSPRQYHDTAFPKQNSVTSSPIQSNATVLPKENKKEIFSIAKNQRPIIYICSIVVLIALLIISLNKGHLNFPLKKPHTNIVQMPTWNPSDEAVIVADAETQVPEDSTEDAEIESTVKPVTQSTAKSATKPLEELPTQSKVGPPIVPQRQSAATPKAEDPKVESFVPRTDTPDNTQRTTSNNSYYIIVGSWPNEVYAKNAQTEFHAKGFRDTGILYEDKKYRIYVNRFENRGNAEKFLIQFRQDNPMYENAWILMQ